MLDYLLFAMRTKTRAYSQGEIIYCMKYERVSDHGIYIKLRISADQFAAIDFEKKNVLDIASIARDQPSNATFYTDKRNKTTKGVKTVDIATYIGSTEREVLV